MEPILWKCQLLNYNIEIFLAPHPKFLYWRENAYVLEICISMFFVYFLIVKYNFMKEDKQK